MATLYRRIATSLAAQPPAEPIADPGVVRRTYRHWRFRTLGAIFAGYATFYLCRKNISVAMPSMEAEGYDTGQLGILLTATSLAYGLSKLVNGVIGDRANVRWFMPLGLCASALVNVLFGLSSALWVLALLWTANGWFQGMGWPPCARSLVQWYSPSERGFFWGIWNASHQVGAAAILWTGGYLAREYGWESTFIYPAFACLLVAALLAAALRDTPESLGLPPVEVWRGDAAEARPAHLAGGWVEQLGRNVLANRYIWLLAFGNFFVYIVRFGALDWAPTFLVKAKGADQALAGQIASTFEIAGIAGAFAAGWLSDRLFRGRRGPVNVLYMAVLVFAVVELWVIPAGHPWLDAAALAAVGFLVYGPQMLVGVAAADLASKEAAAAATGFTGLFGYLGGAVSGVGTGYIVKYHGWNGGFVLFTASAVLGLALFALTWNARPKELCEER